MDEIAIKFIGVLSSLAIANLLYAVLTDKPASLFVERTFFQAIALFVAWVSITRS